MLVSAELVGNCAVKEKFCTSRRFVILKCQRPPSLSHQTSPSRSALSPRPSSGPLARFSGRKRCAHGLRGGLIDDGACASGLPGPLRTHCCGSVIAGREIPLQYTAILVVWLSHQQSALTSHLATRAPMLCGGSSSKDRTAASGLLPKSKTVTAQSMPVEITVDSAAECNLTLEVLQCLERTPTRVEKQRRTIDMMEILVDAGVIREKQGVRALVDYNIVFHGVGRYRDQAVGACLRELSAQCSDKIAFKDDMAERY
nr:hypothetical protein CFP56_67042 [Quercus suber]